MRGSIMTRILIADDHPLVRKGLKDILSGAMGKIEFGEAEDAQQTIAESEVHLDLLCWTCQCRQSGLDTLKQIRRSIEIAYPWA